MARDMQKLSLNLILPLSFAVLNAACAPTDTTPEEGAAGAKSLTAEPTAEREVMSDKISDDLRKAFAAHSDNADHRERVIITMADMDHMTGMEAMEGLDVIDTMGSMPIVVANVDAQALKALAENDKVKRVEPDGEMRIQPVPED